MSRKTDEFPFSEDALRTAAEQVGRSLLSSQTEGAEPPHVFSEGFEAEMDRLLRRRRTRELRQRLLRGTAAVLAALLILSGTWLLTDNQARADFLLWTKEIFGADVVYHFAGPERDGDLPAYTFGWTPEGYTYVKTIPDGPSVRRVFHSEQDGYLFLLYGPLSEGFQVTESSDIPMDPEPVRVSGWEGEFYAGGGEGSSALLWADEEAGIVFTIQANLDRETILKIAEQVVPAE